MEKSEPQFNTLREEDVGITEYICKETIGFDCILKHRYSDFLVNEIDTDGNVVWLRTSKDDNQTLKEATGPSQIKEEEIDLILNENFQSLLAMEDLSKFSEFLYCYVNKQSGNEDRLHLPFIEDKSNRKQFHELIRTHFPFLESETIDNLGNKSKKEKQSKGQQTELNLTDDQMNDKPIKCISVFISKSTNNFHKRRKIFPDQDKKCLHFSLLKRNMDTVSAINYLAKMLHRSNKTLNFAGNKDKRGITTQRISCHNTVPEELTLLSKQKFWDRRIEVGNFTFKDSELRLGMLKGNQFSVVLRFIQLNEPGDLEANVQKALGSLQNFGFITYFGMQRFGVSSVPTHHIGKLVIKKMWKEAIEGILNTHAVRDAMNQIGIKSGDPSDIFKERERENVSDLLKILPRYSIEYKILQNIKSTGKNSYQNAFQGLNRQLQVLYPHAYQSYIWNKTVSNRIRSQGLKLIIGDIVRKSNRQEEEIDLHLEDEILQEEVIQLDTKPTEVGFNFEDNYEYITEDNIHKYSIHDMVIPIVGFKVNYPRNETFEYIQDLLSQDGLSFSDFEYQKVNFNSTGYFRKVIEVPQELKYDLIRHDNIDDDLQSEYYNIEPHPEPKSIENKYTSLRLQFQLPQSTYATMLFRELTKHSSASNYQAELSRNIK